MELNRYLINETSMKLFGIPICYKTIFLFSFSSLPLPPLPFFPLLPAPLPPSSSFSLPTSSLFPSLLTPPPLLPSLSIVAAQTKAKLNRVPRSFSREASFQAQAHSTSRMQPKHYQITTLSFFADKAGTPHSPRFVNLREVKPGIL